MKTDKRERPSFKQKQSGQRRQPLSSSTRDGRKKRPLKKEGSSDSFLICGRNSVSEFLKSRGVRRVFLKEGKKDDRLLSLAALAEKQGVPVEEAKEEKLAFLVNHNHFVVEQLMNCALEHAESAQSLADFLMKVAPERKEQTKQIYRLLSVVESLGKMALRYDVIDAMYDRFCE